MTAIWKDKIYRCGEEAGDGILLIDAKGKSREVSYLDETLIIDPTDSEVDGLLYAGSKERMKINWGVA